MNVRIHIKEYIHIHIYIFFFSFLLLLYMHVYIIINDTKRAQRMREYTYIRS